MSWRAGIHGYAAQWGVMTAPLMCAHTGNRPVIFDRNCFAYDAAQVEIWFMHRAGQSFGKGAALDLELWEDAYGLAFAFRPPTTAFSLAAGIQDGRYNQCSVGFKYAPGHAGAFDSVAYASLHEISIAPRGACPGAVCWHAATPVQYLPPAAAALAPGWHASRARAQRLKSAR